MTLNPYQHGAPCSCCGSYCGVDEYDYKGETVCEGCMDTMTLEGIIVGHCSKCGTLIDDDMPFLLDSSMNRMCEKCAREA